MKGEIDMEEVIADINFIILNLEPELSGKIPKNVKEFFQKNYNPKYKSSISLDKPLFLQKLNPRTEELLTILLYNYIYDEKEKEDLLKQLQKNDEIEQSILDSKVDIKKIFEDNNTKTIQKEESILPIEIKKENLIQKLLSFIKKIISGKKDI